MSQQRAPTAADLKHLGILRDFLNDGADEQDVARAHSALRRCLDGAERACRALAAEGAAKDTANTS